jgi:hypothetical protein
MIRVGDTVTYDGEQWTVEEIEIIHGIQAATIRDESGWPTLVGMRELEAEQRDN